MSYLIPATFSNQPTSMSRSPRSRQPSSFLSTFRCAARLATCLLATTFGITATTHNALANGMPTSLPSSPFMKSSGSNEDFRFSYWESLAQIKVSAKITFEIPLGFTPIPNYQRSVFFGNGFAFPLLESTLLPKSENELEMIFPSGRRQILRKTKIANQLKGKDWLGTINGREVTVKSSSSWTLVYNGGRLKTLKTPDGVTMEFKNDTQGNHWILANGKSVLTLKPAYDANTQKIYHLNIQDGKHAILRLGPRPVLVKTSEKDTFGRTKEKTMDTQALTSIQWDGEPERKYGWTLNEMNVAGNLYKWEKDSINLSQAGNFTYGFTQIKGVNCLKISNVFSGKTTITGSDQKRGLSISKGEDSPLTISENLVQRGDLTTAKRVWQVDENGNEKLILRYWFDENYNVTKLLSNFDDKSILYAKTQSAESAIDFNTKKLLWEKKYDKQGRLISVFAAGKSYNFEYTRDNQKAKITRTFQNEVTETTVHVNELITFFSQTIPIEGKL